MGSTPESHGRLCMLTQSWSVLIGLDRLDFQHWMCLSYKSHEAPLVHFWSDEPKLVPWSKQLATDSHRRHRVSQEPEPAHRPSLRVFVCGLGDGTGRAWYRELYLSDLQLFVLSKHIQFRRYLWQQESRHSDIYHNLINSAIIFFNYFSKCKARN
jgi:hypothetical protein